MNNLYGSGFSCFYQNTSMNMSYCLSLSSLTAEMFVFLWFFSV